MAFTCCEISQLSLANDFFVFFADHARQQSKERRIQNKMEVEEDVMNFIDYDIDEDLELDDKDLETFSEYENCEVDDISIDDLMMLVKCFLKHLFSEENITTVVVGNVLEEGQK